MSWQTEGLYVSDHPLRKRNNYIEITVVQKWSGKSLLLSTFLHFWALVVPYQCLWSVSPDYLQFYLFGPRWTSIPRGKIYCDQVNLSQKKYLFLRNANAMPYSLRNLSPLLLTQLTLSVQHFEQGLLPCSQLFNKDPTALSKCQKMYVLVEQQKKILLLVFISQFAWNSSHVLRSITMKRQLSRKSTYLGAQLR